jgi:hypothetical protein
VLDGLFISMKNKEKRSNKMGPINLDSTAWVQKDKVQESIDSLNAAIDRLNKIINEMKENSECRN